MIEAPKEIYLAKDNHYNYLWCSNQRHYENDIKYIRADLVENEWQNIATAPKNGDWIIVWAKGTYSRQVGFSKELQ